MEPLIISAKYMEGTGHFSNHYHDCNELIYIVGGRASITVGESHYEAPAGSLVLISRFEHHAVEADGEDYCRYTLRLRPDIHGYGAFPGGELLSLLINRPGNFCHVHSLPGCDHLLARIVAESQGDDPMKGNMLDLLLMELLVLLCRAHPQLIRPDSGNVDIVLQVQQYLEENYSRRICLEGLARQFHLSSSYLSHLFKDVTGHSVMGYLKACRIAAAKRLLAQTQLSISQILEDCGFADSSNFSRTFRQDTGLSPSAFRMKYQKNQ